MAFIDFTDPIQSMRSEHWKTEPRLMAITVFDPRFSNAAEITELLSMLDVFSGQHIDILLSGFTKGDPQSFDQPTPLTIEREGVTWYFSPEKLLDDVKSLENETSWKFSMEIDVIVCTHQRWGSKFESGEKRLYENSMVLNIYRMLKDKKITSYPSFFGELIRFARDYSGDDPAWDFSDAKLWKELKGSVFDAFKQYIGFRKFQMRVEDYAIRDITK